MSEIANPIVPVLLVDDEPQTLNSFELTLRSASINNMICCEDSREVMPILSRQEVDVMLLDLRMPHVSGEDLLPMINREFPEIPVIVITGANDVETAVRCMKGGAFDYLVKPVENSRLVGVVKRAIELRALKRENEMLKAHFLSHKLNNPEAFKEIMTINAAMRSIFTYVEAISNSPLPVLITGETGVGKELIAKAVHRLSNRQGAFTPVNVAGLDDNIFADTLFGHIKGAFTDAQEIRKGMIEQASGGTLFLDEIGDLSQPSQIKLLRLLQDSQFSPLGSDVAKRSDARIVIATNKDLDQMQADGRFRKDLYYRLCAHHVRIPPLRDRREDLPVLVQHFIRKAAKTVGKKAPTAPSELIPLLSMYDFPGNIRELEALVFDAVSSHQAGKLSLATFKTYISGRQASPREAALSLDDGKWFWLGNSEKLPTLKQAEKRLIEETLQRAQGNQSIAALSLGISRQALNKRIRKQQSKT